MINKFLVMISLCSFLLFNMNVVHAQTLRASYGTTEDVLLEMMKPEIQDILMEEIGEIIDWNFSGKKVIDLQLIHDHLDPKWFQISLSVEYRQLNQGGKATIELKVIPASLSRENTSNKIKLIDFTDFKRVD